MNCFRVFWVTAGIAGLMATGCGGSSPHVVRGSESPGLDDAAYSTGLDRHDLQQLMHENFKAMWSAPVVPRWRDEGRTGKRPSIAVLPIRNETSEHIDSSLNALISDVETELINSNLFRVVSMENQKMLLDEIRAQQSDGFDQSEASKWGRQMGVHYIVTGKVFTSDERAADSRRVQYYMFLQVLSVETGEILFQNKSALTKAIVS
ncbi:MAG: penicillin-binding protein activator LpoB [Myxococcales bacterium]|nr:penicillin-binding protein activator LpoB [Myxococcales bacterium]MCB9708757.1 penicillin-binding protein activator LpoB [Myxococcales bacterium]